MKVALTGAGGFLGLHTRAAAVSLGHTVSPVALGSKFDVDRAVEAIQGSGRLIHVAGVNRGSDEEISEGNVLFATQLADVLRRVDSPPSQVVFANSIQDGNGSVYGKAKSRAAEILQSAADDVNATFTNVRLPNLYGEHGRPFYNSVVATFCHLIHSGKSPEILDDRELRLLHAQDAADVLLGCVSLTDMEQLTALRTVSEVLRQLQEIADISRRGEIPPVATAFDLNLFNTYRSFRLESTADLPFTLNRRADARGSFFEVCRAHGGQGQTAFSTTLPGVTRGEHFHRRKIERFVVLSGKAQIAMRCLFSDEVVRFEVDGSAPLAIDMPTLWTHKITNTGDADLFTMFWTNDIFDPAKPDTFAQEVE